MYTFMLHFYTKQTKRTQQYCVPLSTKVIKLLKLNLCAGFLKLCLDSVGIFLGSALFNSLGSTLNKLLGFP